MKTDKLLKLIQQKKAMRSGGALPLPKHQSRGQVAPFITSDPVEYQRRQDAFRDSALVQRIGQEWIDYMQNPNTTADMFTDFLRRQNNFRTRNTNDSNYRRSGANADSNIQEAAIRRLHSIPVDPTSAYPTARGYQPIGFSVRAFGRGTASGLLNTLTAGFLGEGRMGQLPIYARPVQQVIYKPSTTPSRQPKSTKSTKSTKLELMSMRGMPSADVEAVPQKVAVPPTPALRPRFMDMRGEWSDVLPTAYPYAQTPEMLEKMGYRGSKKDGGLAKAQPGGKKNSVYNALLNYKESPDEDKVEFFDISGLTSWDDAVKGYDSWTTSNRTYPTIPEAMDMFSAVPLFGRAKKAYEGMKIALAARMMPRPSPAKLSKSILSAQPEDRGWLTNMIPFWQAYTTNMIRETYEKARDMYENANKKQNGGLAKHQRVGPVAPSNNIEVDPITGLPKPYLNPAMVQATLKSANENVYNTLGQLVSTPQSREKARREKVIAKDPSKYSVEDYKQGIQEPGADNSVLSDPIAMAAALTAGDVGLGAYGLSQVPRMFLGNLASEATAGLSDVGKFVTRNTALKNAYKINPWAFKPNPEAYYHRSPNLQNIVNQETGMLQGFGESEAGRAYSKSVAPGTGNELTSDGRVSRIQLKKAANSEMYFSKGTPLDWGRTNMVLDKQTGKLVPGHGYPGPYIAEVTDVPFVGKANGRFTKIFDPETGEYVKGKLPPVGKGNYAVPKRPVSLDETKFYKEDWLRGYKEVPKTGKPELKAGGLAKAQVGEEKNENLERLLSEYKTIQSRINEGYDDSYVKKLKEVADKLVQDRFVLEQSDVVPENILNWKNPQTGDGPAFCIGTSCYIANQAGDPFKFYSNTMAQDYARDNPESTRYLEQSEKYIEPGDILQFKLSSEQGKPYHAYTVLDIGDADDKGYKRIKVVGSSGHGPVEYKDYYLGPDNKVYTSPQGGLMPTQLLKRKTTSKSSYNDAVNRRNELKKQIDAIDPRIFNPQKTVRYNTYLPTEYFPSDSAFFGGRLEDVSYDVPERPNVYVLGPGRDGFQEQIYLKDSKLPEILRMAADKKYDIMKQHNISGDEYDAIVSNMLGMYGAETKFGTDYWGKGVPEWPLLTKTLPVFSSVGPFQLGRNNFSKELKKKYSKDDLYDPIKGAQANIEFLAENIPLLRKRAYDKPDDPTYTEFITPDNYLEYIPYLQAAPGWLRGDEATKKSKKDVVRGEHDYKKLVDYYRSFFQSFPMNMQEVVITPEKRQGGKTQKVKITKRK